MVFDAEPDLEVVAETGDGADAVARALQDGVDLAILDITMPRMTGLQATRELHHRRPELRILILSMHENEQYLYEALKAGAPATLSRSSPTGTSSRRAASRCEASRSCIQPRSPR